MGIKHTYTLNNGIEFSVKEHSAHCGILVSTLTQTEKLMLEFNQFSEWLTFIMPVLSDAGLSITSINGFELKG